MSAIGPRPTHRNLTNAPVPGDALVTSVRNDATGEWTRRVHLLGPGRDNRTRDEVVAGFEDVNRQLTEGGAGELAIAFEVSEVFTTMSDLVAAYPDAKMDGTARGILKAEQAREEHAEAVRQWAAKLEAAGLEPCDRCGGAGGYRGWPGFTCYECNGSGTQEKAE